MSFRYLYCFLFFLLWRRLKNLRLHRLKSDQDKIWQGYVPSTNYASIDGVPASIHVYSI